MKKIALIGASSSIGKKLYPFLCSQMPSDTTVIPTFYSSDLQGGGAKLDITAKDDIESFIDSYTPDVYIWLAGTKNVSKCQVDEAYAHRLNTQPVLDLCQLLKERKSTAHVVFISTDYVFDGVLGGYTEKSKPFPITNYGKSNLISENVLTASGLNWTIVRTAAIIGKGFTYFDWLVNTLVTGNTVAAYVDSVFTPTPITLFCQGIKEILTQNIFHETLHVVGEQAMSRYDFSLIVAKCLGKETLVTADRIPESSTLFQRNLSLVASSMVKRQNISLEKFIYDELRHD